MKLFPKLPTEQFLPTYSPEIASSGHKGQPQVSLRFGPQIQKSPPLRSVETVAGNDVVFLLSFRVFPHVHFLARVIKIAKRVWFNLLCFEVNNLRYHAYKCYKYTLCFHYKMRTCVQIESAELLIINSWAVWLRNKYRQTPKLLSIQGELDIINTL